MKFLHSAQDKAVCMEAVAWCKTVGVGYLGEVHKHRDHLLPLPVLAVLVPAPGGQLCCQGGRGKANISSSLPALQC